MDKTKKDESIFWFYVLFGIILFPITVPLILNILIYRINVKNFLSNRRNLIFYEYENKFNNLTYLNWITGVFYVYITILSILFVSGIFPTFFSNIGYAFAFLFAIGGIFLSIIGIIWFLILKKLFLKRAQKWVEDKEYKQYVLLTQKIVVTNVKKENIFFNWIFCLDLKDKQLEKLDKIDLKRRQKETKDVFLNDNCFIPEASLNKNISIIGSICTGKTTTSKRFIESAFKNEWNVIFLNFKEDNEFRYDFEKMAKKYNKKVLHWITSDIKDFKYNPFKEKTTEECIDFIMNLFNETNHSNSINDKYNYFQIEEFKILNFIFSYIKKANSDINFEILQNWTDRNWLIEKIDNLEFIKDIVNKNDNNSIKKEQLKIKKLISGFNETSWNYLYFKIKKIRNNFLLDNDHSSKNISNIFNNHGLHYLYFSKSISSNMEDWNNFFQIIMKDINNNFKNSKNNNKTLIFFDGFLDYEIPVLKELFTNQQNYNYSMIFMCNNITNDSSEYKKDILNKCTTKILHNASYQDGLKYTINSFYNSGLIKRDYKSKFKNSKFFDGYKFNEKTFFWKLAIGDCLVATEDEFGNKKIYDSIQKVSLN